MTSHPRRSRAPRKGESPPRGSERREEDDFEAENEDDVERENKEEEEVAEEGAEDMAVDFVDEGDAWKDGSEEEEVDLAETSFLRPDANEDPINKLRDAPSHYQQFSKRAAQLDFGSSPGVPNMYNMLEPANAPSVFTPIHSGDAYQRGSSSLQYCDMFHSKYIPMKPHGWRAIWRYFFESPALLVTIGVLSALHAVIVDAIIRWGSTARHNLDQSAGQWVWFAIALGGGSLAFAMTYWCPEATGSGMPQMKVILSGIINQKYLSFKTLVAKSVGLAGAFLSGLSIGKEGPFVQVGGCLADCLMRTPAFNRIRLSSAKRLEMLACACAAGVSATFGTPFGGVLFSVEVTSTFYMIRNLPRAFFAASCGSFIARVLGMEGQLALLQTHWTFAGQSLGPSPWELGRMDDVKNWIVCAIFGSLCGLLGVVFILMVSRLVGIRRSIMSSPSLQLSGAQRGWLMVMLTILFVALAESLVFRISAQAYTEGDLSKLVFADKWLPQERGPSGSEEAPQNAGGETQQGFSVFVLLILFFPMKVLLTALSITLPIPAGMFTPAFLAGGALGRLFGEVLEAYFPSFSTLRPWELAVIGASAYTSGITRAISTAVIVMELTGHIYLSPYIGISIICAYYVGNRFTPDVYDALIDANHLPRLQHLPGEAMHIPTYEVMKRTAFVVSLTADSSYADLEMALKRAKDTDFPIVSSKRNSELLGAVMRRELAASLAALDDDREMVERLRRNVSYRRVEQRSISRYGNTVSRGRSGTNWSQSVSRMVRQKLKKSDRVIFAFNRGGLFFDLVGVMSRQRLQNFLETMNTGRPSVLRAMYEALSSTWKKVFRRRSYQEIR